MNTDRPILFSAPMVRAILNGRKTQTRRVVKVPRRGAFVLLDRGGGWQPFQSDDGESAVCNDGNERPMPCPYGQPGDRLWVRETFARGIEGCPGGLSYRADHIDPRGDGPAHPMTWTPSIHMRRSESRLTLAVEAVRVERLHDITEEDARAEGVTVRCERPDVKPGGTRCGVHNYRDAFADLWRAINGAESWDANPYVWVVTFRRVQP